jgi:hypothetical protein
MGAPVGARDAHGWPNLTRPVASQLSIQAALNGNPSIYGVALGPIQHTNSPEQQSEVIPAWTIQACHGE